jgi:hypothetical protein
MDLDILLHLSACGLFGFDVAGDRMKLLGGGVAITLAIHVMTRRDSTLGYGTNVAVHMLDLFEFTARRCISESTRITVWFQVTEFVHVRGDLVDQPGV